MKSGRGGIRQGAGRKTTWVSGCTQAETKVIRVPKKFEKELLEIAHKLDAGEVIELDTKSIQEENRSLREEIDALKQRLADSSREIKRLKTEKEAQPNQLELFTMSSLPSKEVLVKIRDRCLRMLSAGKQSKQYTQAKYAFDEFISILLSGKH
jgi:predicted  nucleic acid-binding Zn-ribbon protein